MTNSFIQQADMPNPKDQFFATADDWQNNACLSFGRSSLGVYAIGYKEAADILLDYVDKANDRQQDALVYPIIFLYRQYLELALKSLIAQARKLLGDPESFPTIHHIDKLWKLCDSLLERISPEDSLTYRTEVGRLMDEFENVDPRCTAFRYPEDKAGKPSLPALNHIDLRNLRTIIQKVSVFLDGAEGQIDEYLSIKSEMGQ